MPRRKKAKEEKETPEVITKARVSEDGDWEYLVKWAGYDSDADSWEPSNNVKQCNRLLASFWKHVGTDDKDYLVGYEVAAEENWINKEKQFFAETFVKPSRRKSGKATKERQQSESSVSESTVDDSQSTDEEYSAKTSIKMKSNKKARIVDSEPDFDSDGLSHKRAATRPTAPATELPKVLVQAKRQETSTASSSSLPTAPPKAPVVRTHQDQRTNPLVKSMDLPTKSIEAGSLLSTKQRVVAGIPPPPTGPKLLPPRPKSLSSLSFKKNKAPVLPSTQTTDTMTLSTPAPTPISPLAQPTNITDDVETVTSPPMDIDHPADSFDLILDDPEPQNETSPETFSVPIPTKPQEEIDAEAFLRTVNISALSAPLHFDELRAMDAVEQLEQSTTEPLKSPAISKIPKKWKWSGGLVTSTAEREAEPLCTVTIADPGGMSNSSHINLLLSNLGSLQISRLYPIMDLSPLLRACGKPQYFGRLESNESSEEVVLDGLVNHLTNEGLAAVIPLFHDDTEAAVLVVFPTAQKGLTKVLQVPEHLLSETSLLVVFLPLLVSNMVSTKAVGWRSIGTVQKSLHHSQNISCDLSQETVLYQAISLLCFPKALLDFLSSSPTSRPYSIWPQPDQVSSGLDTILLQSILTSTKAISAKVEEDVRVVFISNRHLEMLHTMPSLVTKRLNSPEVQFWTYGYSADKTCERWKVQEIYPLGGIITFTSSALAEDFIGCQQFISQVIEHPLWDCYLIPEALAVSHLLFSDENISTSIESYLGPISDFIDLGLMSVMRMPGRGQSSQIAWPSHPALKEHLEALKSQYATSGMTADQLITFTNKEITQDLLNAQIQPVFMDSYRRFVVIRATSENAIPFDRDGLEWTSLSQFTFKDDYFQS